MTWRLAALLTRLWTRQRKATSMTTSDSAAELPGGNEELFANQLARIQHAEFAAAAATAPLISLEWGVDYSTSRPPLDRMKALKVKFVMRYTSNSLDNDRNGKNLSARELKALLDAGFQVGLVYELAAQRALTGHVAGVADAQYADKVVKALGLTGLPVYFAVDFDATEAQQTAINAYLDGIASVIGVNRTGIYAGFWPLRRALNAGKARYGWQTYAWSLAIDPLPPGTDKVKIGTHDFMFDRRAQLRQVLNGVTIGGAAVDDDNAMAADFGQWPRPVPSGVQLIHADGKTSLRQYCDQHAVTVQSAIWQTAQRRPGGFGVLEAPYISHGDWDALLPQGTAIWAGKDTP